MIPHIHHLSATDAAHALHAGILPWLQEHVAQWQGERLAVITPATYTGHWIKQACATHGIGLLGVDFLTPGRVRAQLARDPRIAFTESPRFEAPEYRLLHAVEQKQSPSDYIDTASLSDAYQILDTMGILEKLPDPDDPFYQYIAAIGKRVRSSKCRSAIESDRVLLHAVLNADECVIWDKVLIYGFGPGDLRLFPLLNAITRLARSTTFIQWEAIDEKFNSLWLNSWESLLGPVEPFEVDSVEHSPMLDAVELLLDGSTFLPPDTEAPISVCAVDSLNAQALKLARYVSKILEQNKDARVGLLFQTLSPQIQSLLHAVESLGIPVCQRSGKKATAGSLPESLGLWLKFQATGELDAYVAFLQARHREGQLPSALLKSITRELDFAFSEVQGVDCRVLFEWIRCDGRNDSVSGFVEHWCLLSDEDSAEVFVESLYARFYDEALVQYLDRVGERVGAFNLVSEAVDRTAWFAWMSEDYEKAAAASVLDRDLLYSPVHAVKLNESLRESWTHICVLDGSHEHWNQLVTNNPWIPPTRLSELNSKCLRPAPSGNGEWVLSGLGVPVLSGDEQQLQADCHRYLLFRQPLQEVRVFHLPIDPLDARTERSLAEWVDAWVRGLRLEVNNVSIDRRMNLSIHVEPRIDAVSLQEAVKARHDADAPYGPFDFSAPDSPDFPTYLAIKTIEYALKDPAAHWYLSVLGLKPRQRFRDRMVRVLSDGSRLHRWLQWTPSVAAEDAGMPSPEFSAIPSRKDWNAQIHARAQDDLERAKHVFGNCGLAVPDWWQHQWQIICSQSDEVVQCFYALDEKTASSWASFEVSLPPGVRMGIEDKMPVQLSGRMDVLLSNDNTALKPGRSQGKAREFRIMDFKSGDRSVPTAKNLSKGDSLQLLLYARALWEMGSRDVAISIISRNVGKAKWQEIDFDDSTYRPILSIVRRMLHGRIFGMRPGAFDAYTFNEVRPISFTELPPQVVEARWNLTHPEWEAIG